MNQAKALFIGQLVMCERLRWLKMAKKTGFQIFCAGVEPLETDMFLLPTPGSSKGTTQVWNFVGSRMRRGKDSELKTRYSNGKTTEVCGSHFGMSSEKGSLARRAVMETKPTNNYVRTATENPIEKSRSVSALSLSPWHCFSLFS